MCTILMVDIQLWRWYCLEHFLWVCELNTVSNSCILATLWHQTYLFFSIKFCNRIYSMHRNFARRKLSPILPLVLNGEIFIMRIFWSLHRGYTCTCMAGNLYYIGKNSFHRLISAIQTQLSLAKVLSSEDFHILWNHAEIFTRRKISPPALIGKNFITLIFHPVLKIVLWL